MSDSGARTTRWQLVLLSAVAIAITALVLLIRDAPRGPTAAPTQETGRPTISAADAYMQDAYERLDTLHAKAEWYLTGAVANADSAASLDRQRRFDADVRADVAILQSGRGLVSDEICDALLTHSIGYLDALDLHEEPLTQARVDGFLQERDRDRGALESVFGPYFTRF